ncbi:MAG: methyltransferase domain-containing protein [Phycisphaerales bacterium]
MASRGDYVLGTHDDELARLGFQHAVWRSFVIDGWRAAGIGAGDSVVDVGAGPGFATVDLARIVGPTGRVCAVERSPRYLDALLEQCRAHGLANVDAHQIDLMTDAIPPAHDRGERADALGGHDAAWCRWVAMFVPSVETLVARIRAALRPGGRVVFHEYSCYPTYTALPQRQGITDFVTEAMRSFRAGGGEASIAGTLLAQLRAQGFALQHARPIARAARPGEELWNWPAGFIRTYVPRLRELGQVDDAWCERVLRDLDAAEADPDSVLVTPTVLEIVARRDGA